MLQCTNSVICIRSANESTNEGKEYITLLAINALEAEEIISELNQLLGRDLQKFYLEDIDPIISLKSLKWIIMTRGGFYDFFDIDFKNLQSCNVNWNDLMFYSKELKYFEFSDLD